ncbi:hypothetical protein AB0758_45565 [Tolypothrix bouteillei VB521301_2]|uniref:hypothetical protein n=1 Tax=Tolypothrix bouteillei TaxID=1246981 RepID=UPI0038B557B6
MLNKYHNYKGSWNLCISATAIALTALLLPACANNEQQATTSEPTADTIAEKRKRYCTRS